MFTHADYPVQVVEDIARLRRRISASGIPAKRSDANLVIGSWNIRALGRFHPEFTENDGSPKRNLRALASIAEVLRRFDVVAIQEIKRDTVAVRAIVDEFLGPNWELILTDVSAGSAGNTERLGFVAAESSCPGWRGRSFCRKRMRAIRPSSSTERPISSGSTRATCVSHS